MKRNNWSTLVETSINQRQHFGRSSFDASHFICQMELNERAAKYYNARLNSQYGNAALQYLYNRGVGEGAILRFNIGVSPDRNTLTQKVCKNGVSLLEMQKAGLSTQNGYDFFRNRIMIPIREPWEGITVAFGGRDLTGDKKAPKYLNTKKTDIYDKQGCLFGLYDVLRMEHNNRVYVVEGYFDAISLLMRGVPAVSACGTALTQSHLNILTRCNLQPIVVMDGDAAGEKSMLKAACLLAKNNVNVKGIYLENGQDPDTFARGFEGDLGTVLEEMIIDPLLLQIRHASNKDATSGKLWRTLKQAGTPKKYIEYTAQRFGVSAVDILTVVRKTRA